MANSSIDAGKRDDNNGDDPKDADLDSPEGTDGEEAAAAEGMPPIRDDGDSDIETDSPDMGNAEPPAPEDATFSAGPEKDDLGEPFENEMAEPRGLDPEDTTPPRFESTGSAPGDGSDDGGYGDESGPSFAGRALMLLIFAVIIFGLSLWIVPNAAPHLPSGIARHLTPGQVELDNRLARIDDRIEAGIEDTARELAALREENAALAERVEQAEKTAMAAQSSATESAESAEGNEAAGKEIARIEQVATDAGRLSERAAEAASEAGEVAASVSRETATLTEQFAGFETKLAELSDQVQAVNESLASSAENGGPAAPELAAAFAGLRKEVEALRERVGDQTGFLTADEAGEFVTRDDLRSAQDEILTELRDAIDALPSPDMIAAKDDIEALREEAEGAVRLLAEQIAEATRTATKAAEVAETAEKSATSAVGRVDDAIRDARLAAVATSLNSRLATGMGFAEALEEAALLTSTSPPQELERVATSGVPTTAELKASFGRPARNAVEATIQHERGDGIVGQARARIGSVLAGRPAGEQQGQNVDAILSRIDARLGDDDAKGALAEAETLPEHAQQALGQWLDRLKERVAAMTAADDWLEKPAEKPSDNHSKGEG